MYVRVYNYYFLISPTFFNTRHMRVGEGGPGGAGLGLTRGGAGRGEGLLVSIGRRDDGSDS